MELDESKNRIRRIPAINKVLANIVNPHYHTNSNPKYDNKHRRQNQNRVD